MRILYCSQRDKSTVSVRANMVRHLVGADDGILSFSHSKALLLHFTKPAGPLHSSRAHFDQIHMNNNKERVQKVAQRAHGIYDEKERRELDFEERRRRSE